MQGNKLRTLQAMRDKAQADVERLWKKYEMTQNPRDMIEFEKAQQGLKTIESQMKSSRQSTPNLQVSIEFSPKKTWMFYTRLCKHLLKANNSTEIP